MNIQTALLSVWQNKHTSTSAIILFACTVIGILWPEAKTKTDEIARAAVVYGLITAGDAKASQPAPEVVAAKEKVENASSTPNPNP